MVLHSFLGIPNISRHLTHPHFTQWFVPRMFQQWLVYSCNIFLASQKQKLSHTSRSWESISACIFHINLWIVWSLSLFLQCSNISDMVSAKPGVDCCLSIHYLRPYKPMEQHNSASWCGHWITWSTVSLFVEHLGHLELFWSFQQFSHLSTLHIPCDHFDSHRCWHIGILFSVCCNNDMSVSSLEIYILCEEHYFKLRFWILSFLLFWTNVRWWCMGRCDIT